MLSSGVLTDASVTRQGQKPGVSVTVNGDPSYGAATTSMAVRLLLASVGEKTASVELTQSVEVPISYGFGASAASALSGVLAVASAISPDLRPEEVAYFAHAADILCRTGLGTVSVIFRYHGAGLIVRAGAPGVAEVMQVGAPGDVRIVTASMASYGKGTILSSPEMNKKVNALAAESARLASDLTLEGLVRAGEHFTGGLGIASPRVVALSRAAKEAGAIGASQNMVGEAVHALVHEEDVGRVRSAMRSVEPGASLGVYGLASRPAVSLASDEGYPTTSSSFV